MDNSTRGGSRAGGAIIMPVPGPANLPPLPGREAQRQALPVREAQRQINNGVTTIPLEAGNSQDDIFYDAPEYCHLDSLVEVLWQAFVVNSDKDPQAAIYDKTFGKDYKKIYCNICTKNYQKKYGQKLFKKQALPMFKSSCKFYLMA